jgi:Xaa-Pro dipeptidase
MTLITRAPDLLQARHTSVIEDVRVWVDREGANPAVEMRAILEEHGCRGKRLGVELESYGLTARNGARLNAALEGFCELVDVSELVNRMRVVKSATEIAYVRRAAELADGALEAALQLAVPGAFEGDILAASSSARGRMRCSTATAPGGGTSGRRTRCSWSSAPPFAITTPT